MYIDKAKITIISGDGGNGCTSFKSFKGKPCGGPDGGDGGKGGDIIFKVDSRMDNLVDYKFQQHFRAEGGTNGSSNLCYGKCGENKIIPVPRGTIIRDAETGGIIADMFDEDACETVLSGGRGGKGNVKFANSTRKTPQFSQLGEKGLQKTVVLELKTIADAGFVGFPNVGKSTLLSVLTSARPKIANYHFTTLTPNLGALNVYDRSFILADIPGIIEGAAQGVGLGIDFLKHVERTRLIIHIVDISGEEGRRPIDDYRAIRRELEEFSEDLAAREEIVVANKIDSDTDEKNYNEFCKELGKPVIKISAVLHEGIDELIKVIYDKLSKLPPAAPLEFDKFTYTRGEGDEFEIERLDDGSFDVTGEFINNLARNVVLDDMQSMAYLQRSLKLGGVFKALKRAGAVEGDTIRILDAEFTYSE